MTQAQIESDHQINDDYVPQFPELEFKVHDMIEKLHEELPKAIDDLVGAYDEFIVNLKSKIKGESHDNR